MQEPDSGEDRGLAAGAMALSEDEFRYIFARVPRLTVEVIIQSSQGVLLTRRASGPCAGLWHIPGGTVRFGEPLVAAVRRVAATELGRRVSVGPFLGYIEYPSHYLHGLDSPVGLAFRCHLEGDPEAVPSDGRSWFTAPPESMHIEQRDFLLEHRLVGQ
jgi:ADP-ribose pyrophosphatase YjhB (NUDIX family)